jgi:hypothetical protein
MNWEALTAISTAFTGLVILLTVLFAARQVAALKDQSSAMADQLEHLRRATQLTGTLAIFDELFRTDVIDAYRFVINDFAARMKDATFRAEALERTPNLALHKELVILRHLERVGTLVSSGLVDADVLLSLSGYFVIENWSRLEPLVLEQRRHLKLDLLWTNFERLARLAEKYISALKPAD